MAKAWIATVHILIQADSEVEAADALSGLLTEGGIYDDAIMDWSYTSSNGALDYGKQVEIPDDYDRDKADLCKIATG
jgi:hypothetical protein